MDLRWYDILREDGKPAPDYLSEERKQRAAAMRDEADRLRTVAGETMAREMLAARLGCQPREVPLQYDEDGKPEVPGTGLFVSVSHSGAYVVCAVDDAPVGVDVETVRDVDEKFMRRVCSEEELAYVLRGGDRERRFWELWTAKEAVFKLTGHGPLLRLSKLALPENVTVCYTEQFGCAMTVARGETRNEWED
jgi:4'-phosphopantetheinyl transferase